MATTGEVIIDFGGVTVVARIVTDLLGHPDALDSVKWQTQGLGVGTAMELRDLGMLPDVPDAKLAEVIEDLPPDAPV